MAQYFPIEIIGADSRQLFRGMDIGTDKVSQSIRDTIPHHQIDIINPDQHYTAGQWKFDTEKLIEQIQSR
jgi:tRNA dimethylallyltransferase